MKTIIHVNQHKIKANNKLPSPEDPAMQPVLTCKTYKSNDYGFEAVIRDDQGREMGRFMYRPQDPLSCGAHVWFETQQNVEVIS